MEKKGQGTGVGNFRVRPNEDGSVALSLGEVSIETGAGSELRIERDTTYDGQGTHYRVSGAASDWIRSGAAIDGYGYSTRSAEGGRTSYEITLPPPYRMDPRVVNPFDPEAMPAGTRIRFESARRSERESTTGLHYVDLVDETSREEGHSIQIEKTGAHTVRVTAGPDSAFERYGAVGIPLVADITPELGRRDTLADASLRTAEFDLSTPEGRLAYGRFMSDGRMPERGGPGVADVAATERLASTSQPGIRVPLPGTDAALELGLEGSRGAGSVTRHDDGSVVVRNARSYDSGVPLVEEERIGAQGDSTKTYTFAFTPDNGATAFALNAAFSEDPQDPGRDLFRPGRTTTVVFTREQMQALWDMSLQAQRNNPFAFMLDGGALENVRSPDDFAEMMMRRLDGRNAVPELLRSIADNVDGRGDARRESGPLPGTVSIAGQPQRGEANDAAALARTGSGLPLTGVPLTSAGHADNPLFAAIRDRAPADIGDDALALATLRAKAAGITVDNLYQVLRGPNNPDALWVTGSPPASLRTSIDLTQPAPPLERTSAELAQAQEAAQVQEQQRAAQVRS